MTVAGLGACQGGGEGQKGPSLYISSQGTLFLFLWPEEGISLEFMLCVSTGS